MKISFVHWHDEHDFKNTFERDALKHVFKMYEHLIYHVVTIENEYWKGDYRGTFLIWYKDESRVIPSHILNSAKTSKQW